MFLGIEIGGTKLQLGVGDGSRCMQESPLRLSVDPVVGASGILKSIQERGKQLIADQPIQRIGVGCGGPVDRVSGRAIKSHQIPGWENFPLVDWCQKVLGLPAVLGNDCDVAAMAESRFGAGQGKKSLFYLTVGTGVGGGLVLEGDLYGK